MEGAAPKGTPNLQQVRVCGIVRGNGGGEEGGEGGKGGGGEGGGRKGGGGPLRQQQMWIGGTARGKPHTCSRCGLVALSSSTSVKKLTATERSASIGHSRNQSMVQQLTSEGNMRRRWRNASPMGL